jgi:hypothetical protein
VDAEELAAFTAPADSILTGRQVDQYLRTAAAQFDLIRTEGPAVRAALDTVRRERTRPPAGGAKAPRPKSRQALWSDFVDAAFVRAARGLRYSPAELLYVRARISAVNGYRLASGMHASRDQAAALFRQQAEAMRGAPGVSQAQVDAMLRAAEQAEQQAPPPVDPRLVRNLEVLRQGRTGLDDVKWDRITAVAAGVELGGLGDAPAAEFTRRVEELRQLHQEALESRDGGPR